MLDEILNTARDHMRKAVEVTSQDLASIRSGRATPALVENIVISAYENTQHLRVLEMATITTMDSKTIVVAPYDLATLVDLQQGIQSANTGLSPVIDKEIIRIVIPPLSEERRHEYIKLAKTKLEAGRIMIRQIRHEAMKNLKKIVDDKTVSEDEEKHGDKLVQELTDEMIAEIDTLEKKKETELLQI
jgi:ribosome recycling factor